MICLADGTGGRVVIEGPLRGPRGPKNRNIRNAKLRSMKKSTGRDREITFERVHATEECAVREVDKTHDGRNEVKVREKNLNIMPF